jgi:DNA-binding CsgD family transcriptional regulator
MLVGREPEQQQIAALVAGARVRQSGVLVLCGDAGIGKTALLEHSALHGGEMRVLRTSGNEHESGLGFAGLHQLLLPALDLVDQLPGPQRDAIVVALMLDDGPTPERFAVAAAALTLLSRYAEEAPLLLLVDDAHLLDTPSAETLGFVARRLVADPIALLISLRPEPDVLAPFAGLPTLELAGIDLVAATALLAETMDEPPPSDVTARLHHATEGNPLALVELARGTERIDQISPEVPLPLSETVARAFARRVSGLSGKSQRALLLAAVADGDLSTISGAASALDTDVELLTEAEAAGLLRLRLGRAEFRHPLVRSAIYSAADPALRRQSHRAVAAALPHSSLDRRAWHLSEACVGPDDAVADALAETAARARARGAYGAATAALARSAELTYGQAERGKRLFLAGDSAWLAGHVSQADQLLSQSAALVSEPVLLSEIDGVRGNLALRTGSLRDARALLMRAAMRAESFDADATVALLADAITACFYLCDTQSGLMAADTVERLLDSCRTEMARTRGRMAVGMARILAGGDGVAWIRTAVTSMVEDPALFEDPRRPDWLVIGTLFLRESAAGRDLIARVVSEQRARTALGALPNLLFHTARDDATTEHWSAAVRAFDEGIALAREIGQTTDLAASLAGLAWLQARMGRGQACRENCAEVESLAREYDIALAELWVFFALGDLHAASGDPAAAVRYYKDLEATMNRIGFGDVDVSPGPELAEAQLRCGDIGGAVVTARDYADRARKKGQPWALARAHRAMALITADAAERNALFESALELHQGSLDLYEEARTRLAYGGSLRRDKSRVAARPHLRLALEQFERLEAQPWADLSADELAATGERAHRGGESRLAILTAQEMRVAALLADGATTKEAAAVLFLSPKTVEYHLRHAYQKLGISSRRELTELLV